MPPNPDEQNKVLDRWQESARYWEKYRTIIAEIFMPLTTALVEEARIGPGQNVLDIGGGSGEPSLTISSVVGPTGSVMFTDPIAGMVEATHAEATRRGLTNIKFRQCSGDDLPFADGTFDVAVARLSVMFFANPAAGVGQALRVIRDGGLLAFVVWGPEEANPFFTAVNEVMERFVPAPPDDPDAPDAFRFAPPDKLAAILRTAGVKDVVERQLNFQIQAPISFEQFWQMRTEMSETLREAIAKLPADQLPTVKESIAGATRRYFANGTMNFPAQALIVSGKKSAST